MTTTPPTALLTAEALAAITRRCADTPAFDRIGSTVFIGPLRAVCNSSDDARTIYLADADRRDLLRHCTALQDELTARKHIVRLTRAIFADLPYEDWCYLSQVFNVNASVGTETDQHRRINEYLKKAIECANEDDRERLRQAAGEGGGE